uniref:Nuclease n=1 Tax=OCS116 cluster bacterium TaxID=2030921 RepID=A0A2A4Z6N2_9PROT
MPHLKRRKIFISHAWQYSEHYETMVRWLNGAPNFVWSNCSVPRTNPLGINTKSNLEIGITNQINPAQIVIILGGMYANHSDWIDYEISEAARLRKIIIGVRPWGQERVPLIVQNASDCELVGWNQMSIIRAVRGFL